MQVPKLAIILAVLAALFWFSGGGEAIAAPVAALAFGPDSETVWFGGRESLLVASVKDGAIQRRLPLDFPKINSLAFSPNGRLLAVAGGTPGQSGVAVLFDWKEAKTFQHFTNYQDVATSVAFSPDGRRLAVASADHNVDVFRIDDALASRERAVKLIGHAGPVLAVAFSPTGQSIVTASADRSLKVWAVEDGKLIRSFNHHTEIVHALAFRPLDKAAGETRPAYCASGSDDQTVRVWQPEIGRMVRIVRGHDGPIFAVAFSRDGTRLFSAGREGIVRVIDADSDEILAQWPAHDDWVYSLAISPDGTTMATGDWAGRVELWDLKADGARFKTQAH